MSWGTKGSDKAEALPTVSTKKGGADKEAEEKIKPQEDVDAAFKETVSRALHKLKVKEAPENPTMDDQNKTFRTRLVAVWMLTNAGLSVMIANLQGLPSGNDEQDAQRLQSKQQLYFAIILYSTFLLALVRFCGVSTSSSPLSVSFPNQPFTVCILLLQAELVQALQEVISDCAFTVLYLHRTRFSIFPSEYSLRPALVFPFSILITRLDKLLSPQHLIIPHNSQYGQNWFISAGRNVHSRFSAFMS